MIFKQDISVGKSLMRSHKDVSSLLFTASFPGSMGTGNVTVTVDYFTSILDILGR